MHTASLCVLVEPRPQAWPLTQECLVRDLDGALGHGDEPRVGEHVQGHLGGRVAIKVELRQGCSPADDGAALVDVRETKEDPFRGGPPVTLELGVSVLGEPRDGALDAATRPVGIERQRPVAAARPQLEQRG